MHLFSLAGKVALVPGAGSGIGSGIGVGFGTGVGARIVPLEVVALGVGVAATGCDEEKREERETKGMTARRGPSYESRAARGHEK